MEKVDTKKTIYSTQSSIKENKMPRAKKTTTTKKRAPRKNQRRKTQDRRRSNPGDIFWTKVVKGFEKFLESPFK